MKKPALRAGFSSLAMASPSTGLGRLRVLIHAEAPPLSCRPLWREKLCASMRGATASGRPQYFDLFVSDTLLLWDQ
jgi:hypothetical protein